MQQVWKYVFKNSKNLQITSKLLTQGYRYQKLRKTFGKLNAFVDDSMTHY